MSSARPVSPAGSPPSLSDNDDFVVIQVTSEQLVKHAQEIAALKKSHADAIAELEKSYEEKMLGLKASFDQLQAENEAVKARLAIAEEKINANKESSVINRFGFYNPMFYPFNRNFKSLNSAGGILPLQQFRQRADEQPLSVNTQQTSVSSTTPRPSSPK